MALLHDPFENAPAVLTFVQSGEAGYSIQVLESDLNIFHDALYSNMCASKIEQSRLCLFYCSHEDP